MIGPDVVIGSGHPYLGILLETFATLSVYFFTLEHSVVVCQAPAASEFGFRPALVLAPSLCLLVSLGFLRSCSSMSSLRLSGPPGFDSSPAEISKKKKHITFYED